MDNPAVATMAPPSITPNNISLGGTKGAALKLMRKLWKKYGFVPDKLGHGWAEILCPPQPVILESQNATSVADGATFNNVTTPLGAIEATNGLIHLHLSALANERAASERTFTLEFTRTTMTA
jgi:hypothetical protein